MTGTARGKEEDYGALVKSIVDIGSISVSSERGIFP